MVASGKVRASIEGAFRKSQALASGLWRAAHGRREINPSQSPPMIAKNPKASFGPDPLLKERDLPSMPSAAYLLVALLTRLHPWNLIAARVLMQEAQGADRVMRVA